MKYYPKSQIQPSLYTNGGEYILSTTKEEYFGNYFKTSNNLTYTGTSPDNKPNILLYPILDIDKDGSHNGANENPLEVDTTIFYPNSNASTGELFIPQFNTPLPTSSDYKKEIFTRYFCKKTNENKYIEINQITYNKLQTKDSSILWSLYTPFSIQWKISPNESKNLEYNYSSVSNIGNTTGFTEFSNYIKNYSQYSPSQSSTDNINTASPDLTPSSTPPSSSPSLPPPPSSMGGGY